MKTTQSNTVAASTDLMPHLAVGRQFLAIACGSALLALSARFSVPFFPVPMTFQSLVVLLMGAVLGPRLAAATVAAYLAQGLTGLPVFAGTPEKGVGLAYVLGPTGGYLFGFLAAAVLVGLLARKGFGRSVPTAFVAMALGTAALYVPGLLWLGAVVGWDKPVLEFGLYPFLYGDALKLAIASAAMPMIWRYSR